MALEHKKERNFSEWYTEAIRKAEFIEYSDVSGCIIIRDAATYIWEQIRDKGDTEFRKLGVKNYMFPLLIPEKFLKKEQEFVEDFNPLVAWVTHSGKSKLQEKLAVRPTSEAIMYPYLAKWIRSWKDLPFKMNQWVNVVRWEFKHPVPFFRTREFWFNEGHTAFATKESAASERDKVLKIYKSICEDLLALPGIIGRKTDKEKFAGAEASYSIEHLLPNKLAIQGPAFHDDGQKFSKAYNVTFLDKNQKKQYVWQNTWAISTRNIGVMLATHGDNKGLIVPPRIANVQVVIIPIYKAKEKKLVIDSARKIASKLGRAYLDDRDEYSPGWKFNEWELKGVPLRIEIGPRDLKKKQVVLIRRDTGAKKSVSVSKVESEVKSTLEAIQKNLFKNAKKFLKDNTHIAKNLKEFEDFAKRDGFIQASWCGAVACEEYLKDEFGTKATNMPFDSQKNIGKCVRCGKPGKHVVNWAKSY